MEQGLRSQMHGPCGYESENGPGHIGYRPVQCAQSIKRDRAAVCTCTSRTETSQSYAVCLMKLQGKVPAYIDRFDEPPSLYFRILYTAAIIRKLIIQYFALPRPRFRRKRWFSENPNAAGYIHADHFIDRPWYIESSFLGRWGPGAIVKRIFGGVLPGDEGDKYVPQGYRLAEIGPAYLKGKGFQEMEQTRIKLRANPRQGCPFAAWN